MRQFEQVKTVSGNSPFTLTFPEAAAQSFEKGEPLLLTAAGTVSVSVSPVIALGIVGIAAMPATGVTGSNITVWIANDDTIFAGVMAGAVQADIGDKVTPTKTGALWALDRTTPGIFQVQEIETLPNLQKIARGRFLESAGQMAVVA